MADSLPLPRNHAYLEDASAVTITPQHEVESSNITRDHKSCIPVMFLEFVLFPGSILPIRISDPNIVSFLKRNIQNGNPAKLGVAYNHGVSRRVDEFKGAIGTIATVTFTHSQHQPSSSPTGTEFVATAIGGNRFEILQEEDGHYTFFHVQEIAPSTVPFVGPYVQHLPKIISKNQSDQTLRRISMVSGVPLDRIISKVWPKRIMEVIEKLLQDYGFTSILTQDYPNDPENFSFWLSANLAIDQDEKALLLKAETVAERLALLKRHLEKLPYASATLKCQWCQRDVAMVKETFAVPGADGVSGNYVNPNGVLHQTITVHRLINNQNVFYSGGLESMDSWFPGYLWKIMHCGCGNFLGWRFEAEERFRSTQPPFFAFSSFQVSLATQETYYSSALLETR